MKPAAFGRLCVETTLPILTAIFGRPQPPSGGCVLKLKCTQFALCIEQPAAFGRLCVETISIGLNISTRTFQPPSGGCVLKPQEPFRQGIRARQPPSGGCVLKRVEAGEAVELTASRLRAAVC